MLSFSLGKYVSFQAELFAILACVHDIKSHGIPKKHVSIFSVALKAFGAVRTSPLVRQYHEALNEISALAEYVHEKLQKIYSYLSLLRHILVTLCHFMCLWYFRTSVRRLYEGNLLSVTFSADRQTLSCSSYDCRYLLTDSAKGDKTSLMGKATNLDWPVQTHEPTKSVSSLRHVPFCCQDFTSPTDQNIRPSSSKHLPTFIAHFTCPKTHSAAFSRYTALIKLHVLKFSTYFRQILKYQTSLISVQWQPTFPGGHNEGQTDRQQTKLWMV
jgi:hypothetical protein